MFSTNTTVKTETPCFVALYDFGHRNVTKLVHILAFEKLPAGISNLTDNLTYLYTV